MSRSNSQRHDTLYLLDGNIVLIAPRKNGQHTIFRVHQSFLSKISPVFETMLTLPRKQTNETYDGVPSVDLPDDADAVESLLKVLYHES
jgi:BTB/POZ domain